MEPDAPTGITKAAVGLFDGMFVHFRWGTFIAWGIFTRTCMIHISDNQRKCYSRIRLMLAAPVFL